MGPAVRLADRATDEVPFSDVLPGCLVFDATKPEQIFFQKQIKSHPKEARKSFRTPKASLHPPLTWSQPGLERTLRGPPPQTVCLGKWGAGEML